jgi:ABC transport system ATP-binding/permease protein
LLDEPTNDLDIPTLEILEESLLEYTGALVLVTHDRYMLDRVSTMVLGLDGCGGAESFADYLQWEEWQAQSKQPTRAENSRAENDGSAATKPTKAAEGSGKKKLSYLEAREFATIEQRIAQAEETLQQKRAAAEDPSIASEAAQLLKAHAELEEAQQTVDELYGRWAELEAKQS